MLRWSKPLRWRGSKHCTAGGDRSRVYLAAHSASQRTTASRLHVWACLWALQEKFCQYFLSMLSTKVSCTIKIQTIFASVWKSHLHRLEIFFFTITASATNSSDAFSVNRHLCWHCNPYLKSCEPSPEFGHASTIFGRFSATAISLSLSNTYSDFFGF